MNPKNRSLLATALLVACVVVLLQRGALIGGRYVALGLQLLAIALMVWARLTFGMRSFHATANPTAGGLVTAGPYRYWRHPIYASIIYFVWAGQVQAPGAIPLALAATVSLGLGARMLLEERFLTRAYPEYPQYAKTAKRLIPFVY